jgi:hypothetical protein
MGGYEPQRQSASVADRRRYTLSPIVIESQPKRSVAHLVDIFGVFAIEGLTTFPAPL